MTLHVSDSVDDLKTSSASVGHVATTRRPGVYRNYIKRVLDTVLILIAAPFVVPLIAVLALVVSLDGSNPFYQNKRVGRNGRVFAMLKLRTMVPDADRMLADYIARNPAAREEWNRTQKLKRDPRITWIGRILRKTSIDELPQLWNVLIGDMSLVGPRPMMPQQRALYPGAAYYALRPGITGPWQVSDRNESEFAKRAEYDLAYDRQLSLAHDVALILRTFRVVLKGTGY